MQARDARQQTAWYAMSEGSTKKGFNILTSSSSLLAVRKIGRARQRRRRVATHVSNDRHERDSSRRESKGLTRLAFGRPRRGRPSPSALARAGRDQRAEWQRRWRQRSGLSDT